MINQMFTCDENPGDFMELELDGTRLYIQVSEGKTTSIMILSNKVKIQELIDCLEKAKEDLYQ